MASYHHEECASVLIYGGARTVGDPLAIYMRLAREVAPRLHLLSSSTEVFNRIDRISKEIGSVDLLEVAAAAREVGDRDAALLAARVAAAGFVARRVRIMVGVGLKK